MSQTILEEVTFFFHSFLTGIVITLAYDGFLILRRVIRHNLVAVSLEDAVFWLGCAAGVFYMLYEENNGILRWFAVLGAAIGMALYKISVSRLFVELFSGFLLKAFGALFRVLRFVLRPMGFLGRKTARFFSFLSVKGRKVGKYVKNRLTHRIKILKMILCKH